MSNYKAYALFVNEDVKLVTAEILKKYRDDICKYFECYDEEVVSKITCEPKDVFNNYTTMINFIVGDWCCNFLNKISDKYKFRFFTCGEYGNNIIDVVAFIVRRDKEPEDIENTQFDEYMSFQACKDFLENESMYKDNIELIKKKFPEIFKGENNG